MTDALAEEDDLYFMPGAFPKDHSDTESINEQPIDMAGPPREHYITFPTRDDYEEPSPQILAHEMERDRSNPEENQDIPQPRHDGSNSDEPNQRWLCDGIFRRVLHPMPGHDSSRFPGGNTPQYNLTEDVNPHTGRLRLRLMTEAEHRGNPASVGTYPGAGREGSTISEGSLVREADAEGGMLDWEWNAEYVRYLRKKFPDP